MPSGLEYAKASSSPRRIAASVAAVPEPISPTITASSLSQLVQIGAWTTSFYPDISNGNGANIRVPAGLLNGQIVAPGQQFSFLSAVAPIDLAHGYAMGGSLWREPSVCSTTSEASP